MAEGQPVTVPNIFDSTSVSNYMIHPAATLWGTHTALQPYRPWCVHTARRALRALRTRRADGVSWQTEHIEHFERLLARHNALVEAAMQRQRMRKQVSRH